MDDWILDSDYGGDASCSKSSLVLECWECARQGSETASDQLGADDRVVAIAKLHWT